MREHKKIYSNQLYCDALYHQKALLKQLDIDAEIIINKDNNDFYEVTLLINDCVMFKEHNTIDVLHARVKGYVNALYDVINYKIIRVNNID